MRYWRDCGPSHSCHLVCITHPTRISSTAQTPLSQPIRQRRRSRWQHSCKGWVSTFVLYTRHMCAAHTPAECVARSPLSTCWSSADAVVRRPVGLFARAVRLPSIDMSDQSKAQATAASLCRRLLVLGDEGAAHCSASCSAGPPAAPLPGRQRCLQPRVAVPIPPLVRLVHERQLVQHQHGGRHAVGRVEAKQRRQ